MRIVLDLQGAQTTGSRNRGIGRYTLSLAQAIARKADDHEVLVALNDLFPETVEPIRAAFDGLIPKENIKVWQASGPVRELEPTNKWLRNTAEQLREAFLASLTPDVLHVSSMFEGLVDDAVTSIGTFTSQTTTAVTLYDLIPLQHRKHYLQNPSVEAWYEQKLNYLRRSDLWLAISESSRREGIDLLGLPEDWVVNISSAADRRFHPTELTNTKAEEIRQHYGLRQPFVMYTGGIDFRKNIDGLIRAYARLPEDIRRAHQLAVVCSIQSEDKRALENLVISQGLGIGEVVFSGFVPDEDLIALYNLCKVFVFPSWHEGFGLPALEAMACGAAVIGSNTSSIPEVIGRDDALFDPFDDNDISAKLNMVLTNSGFCNELRQHGLEQSKKFSWENSANRVIEAFERLHYTGRQGNKVKVYTNKSSRQRLAYVSPLPPEKSGIADYSAELLPELARYYDIDVIVDQRDISNPWIKANCRVRDTHWFDNNANRYDRIIYHFGNSSFHQHMFELLERHPGLVVLHDFYLSGIIAHMDVFGIRPHIWAHELYKSHGYQAVQERFQTTDHAGIIYKYPCNVSVLQHAKGMIVHSDFSRQMATHWYGAEFSSEWNVIPLLRAPAQALERYTARKALGLEESDFVICSFGHLGRTKLNHRILTAWMASSLAQNKCCKLIFVGENDGGEYGIELQKIIRSNGFTDQVKITGFASVEQYRQFLVAADVAVQLRSLSRGETSAAVLDCMNYGLPTVVNSHGSLSELPEECIVMLADEFADCDLVRVLEELWNNPESRQTLGEKAREYIKTDHSPRLIAEQYYMAIENFYNSRTAVRDCLVKSIATLEGGPSEEGPWINLAQAVAENLPLHQPRKQLLVDVSELLKQDDINGLYRLPYSIIKELLNNPPEGFRVEPVYAASGSFYRYARCFTLKLLNCPGDILSDDPVELNPIDTFLDLNLDIQNQNEFLAKARRLGVGIFHLIYDFLPVHHSNDVTSNELDRRWPSVVAQGDGALCTSRKRADKFSEWLNETQPERHRPFSVGWIDIGLVSLQGEIALNLEGVSLQTLSESTMQIVALLADMEHSNWIHRWLPGPK